MSTSDRNSTCVRWLVVALLSALAAGCGGNGRQPIFGSSGIAGFAPTVTAVTPIDGETGVSINTATITAAFSEPMAPFAGGASFEITCSAPCVNPTGTVGLHPANVVAAITLTNGLAPLTLYTVTISGARSLVSGLELASPYVWHFTTGVAPDTTPPTVSSTSPLANAGGVAVNALVSASFSEPMDPLSITTGNFVLACPVGAPITGTVGYAVNGNVVTFSPVSNLPASTTCTATINAGVRDVAHNAMASPYTWTFTTGVAPDTTPPTVSSTGPAAGATGVAFNTLVTASFSEPMDPLTISTANFALACPAGNLIAGSVGYAVSGNVATFTPGSSLPASTICTATISTGVQDVAHNAMAGAYTWSFTTGIAPDTTPPTVSSTSPLANAGGVAINTLITASFSEPMDPLSIGTANFALACPSGTPIGGTVGYAVNGNVASFTPASNLPASTVCTATINPSVRDVAHNAMASAYTWSFTTGATPDTTPPTVSSTSPSANVAGVAINALITASFSEPMDPLTINTANFTLACPAGTPVVGSVGYAVSGNVASFTPGGSLPASTICTATISTGVQDVAHNAMAGAYTWSFTTGAAPDTTPPTVSSTHPLTNAGAVAINTLITASFSEPMDPLSITTANFALACPAGTPVAGTVGYAVNGNVATFSPVSNLPASIVCTATISTGVQDVADNAMSAAYTWSFTTGVAPDTTPPTVSSTGPVAGAGAVPINTLITASFSEPMDPLTITPANFALACPAGTPIAGTVGYAASGNVATFSPASSLPASTICRATISTGVQDVAHNAMAGAYTWSFTTGVAPDTTPPTVSSTNPLANAGGVPINTLITASFSEPMDPLTITTANVSLACPVGTPVAGTVGYAVSGNVATFTSVSSLPASTICTATISTGVQDVAHNGMAGAYTWSFTTGVAPDITPPTVSSTGPVAGAGAVAINTLITASFSEPMDPLTITTANFALACPVGTPVAGTVAYAVSGNVATFTPASSIPASTSCTATINTGVQDVAHNAMASAYSWSFTTGVAPDTTPPTVSSTSPLGNASGVAVNVLITASFSEPMDPLTITTANFALACPAGTPIAGTVAYAVNGNAATLSPGSSLPFSTICTATINTGVQDAAHNGMASAYTWSFTTGAAPDTTPPTVSSTSPIASATGVAVNALITASFSEPMDPLTINTANFTLACPADTSIAGSVGYAVSGNVASFTPGSGLPASTVCTATISTGVQDVAGNAMASAYSWTFTTGVAPDTTPPTVISTNPGDGAVGVCVNKTVNVTFSEPMDPLTITTATFSLAVTAGASVTGVVSYDAATHIATFRPGPALIGTPATNYTATIKGGAGGVKDLAGNALAIDQNTTFTTNASTCTTAPALGAAATFGGFGGSATLTNDGLATVINGDIGVNAAATTITGLHDLGGNAYTITTNNNGFVNGTIYTLTTPTGSVPGQAVSQAQGDALAAFNSISPANLPGGIDVSNVAQCPSCGGLGGGADELAGRTLPPGIYRSATYDIGGAARTQASLTLDAGGDANAVWVFQTTPGTGTLNVGLTGPATPAVPIKVLLINGAQSKNVFWFVPAGATIGTGSTMVGTMLANASITMSTTGGSPPTAVVTTINGRALALTAAVTMTNTVINVPPP